MYQTMKKSDKTSQKYMVNHFHYCPYVILMYVHLSCLHILNHFSTTINIKCHMYYKYMENLLYLFCWQPPDFRERKAFKKTSF